MKSVLLDYYLRILNQVEINDTRHRFKRLQMNLSKKNTSIYYYCVISNKKYDLHVLSI